MTNPYLNIYSQLSSQLTNGMVDRKCMFVAEQAARLHNTLGVVIGDLIKVLSTAYNQAQVVEKIGQDSSLCSLSMQKSRGSICSNKMGAFSSSSSILEVFDEDDSMLKQSLSNPALKQETGRYKSKKRSFRLKNPENFNYDQQKSAQNLPTIQMLAEQPLKSKPGALVSYRVSCQMCNKFYSIIGGQYQQVCQCTSRHHSSKTSLTRINDFDSEFRL